MAKVGCWEACEMHSANTQESSVSIIWVRSARRAKTVPVIDPCKQVVNNGWDGWESVTWACLMVH